MRKIMFVTPYFYPKIGGLENYAYNIAKGLKKKYNWSVVIVTSNQEQPNKYKEESIDGMKIYRLPRWFKLSNTPINPMWYFQIKKIIKEEKPDVINAHTPVPFMADVVARVVGNIPFVLTYHNDLVKENLILNLIIKKYYWLWGNKTLRLSKNIIATSNFYANNSRYLNKYKNSLEIVSPGTNISSLKTKKIINNSILFVSQLDKTHKHKGLNYLLEAISLAKSKIDDIKLIVCGKGDNLEDYNEQASNLNITNNVKFTGFINDRKLDNYYSSTTLTILPSTNKSEGFGMVLIEAMAHKKPVIGSNVGGIPYVIDNGKNGLLVPPKNPKALAEAILKILNNPKLAKKMGENGYKKVKKNFTWNIQIDKTNKLLNSLIK